MWFRAEHIEVLKWAGNPHKDSPTVPGATLTPRASFEAWSESVRGKSRRWSYAEVEAAGRLVKQILEARNNDRMRDLNRELTTTLRENENLLTQKDYLLKEVNHRVQNSLMLVSSFLRMQAKASASDEVKSNLDAAQKRLNAVALVHRRLYQDDSVEIIDLSRYIESLLADMMTTMDAGWSETLSLELAPVLISTDRAVNIGLVLTELFINAQKYAYDGKAGPLAIDGLHRCKHRHAWLLHPELSQEVDRVLADVALVVESRLDVDRCVGHDQQLVVGGNIEDIYVADATIGAQPSVARHHSREQLVGMLAPLDQQRDLSRSRQLHGSRCCRVAVLDRFDREAFERDAGRLRRGADLGLRPHKQRFKQTFVANLDRAENGGGRAGMDDRRPGQRMRPRLLDVGLVAMAVFHPGGRLRHRDRPVGCNDGGKPAKHFLAPGAHADRVEHHKITLILLLDNADGGGDHVTRSGATPEPYLLLQKNCAGTGQPGPQNERNEGCRPRAVGNRMAQEIGIREPRIDIGRRRVEGQNVASGDARKAGAVADHDLIKGAIRRVFTRHGWRTLAPFAGKFCARGRSGVMPGRSALETGEPDIFSFSKHLARPTLSAGENESISHGGRYP